VIQTSPLLGLLASLSLATAAAPASEVPPPGMVKVEGGDTFIGTDTDRARELIEESGQRNLVDQTPLQKRFRVGDFYMMSTEVTNEQFLAYVRATGNRPPQGWAEAAIDAARAEYLEAQNERRKAAREANKPIETVKFDSAAWWERNWEGAEWEFPEGSEKLPVVYVTYSDAVAYARWAGMRLPTEFEFQRAGRGDTQRDYPWGDDFVRGKFAHTVENKVDRPRPVGSFPAGGPEGIHDLSGNVWEWTSSPYVAYDKYVVLEVTKKVGRKKVSERFHAAFDPNQRVTVGGSYKNTAIAARLPTRRGTERSQSTNGMGFRCAASPTPGADVAVTVFREDLPPSERPQDVEYDLGGAVATDRWVVAPSEDREEGDPLLAYRVIEDYDHVLVVPVLESVAVNMKDMGKLADAGLPVHMGVLSTTVELLEPALPAGTYLVAWRGAGEFEEPRKRAGKEEEEAALATDPLADLAFDRDEPHWIYFSTSGTPLTAVPAAELEFGRIKTAGKLNVLKERPSPEQLEDDPTLSARDVLSFQMNTLGRKSRSKGFHWNLNLAVAPDTTAGWRR
jgi:formylglycine-generating enzyme required for sulfatase activity